MVSALRDEERFPLDAVDQPVLSINPARPPAGQTPPERLGLASPHERGAGAFFDQPIQAFELFAVMLLPVKVIIPGLFMED